jgi:2'-5' RNA ligase
MERQPGGGAARLFFGLPVDEALAASLAGLAGPVALQAGGRPVVASNFHATLAFLGAAPRASIEALRVLGDGVAAARCDVLLDRVGSFRGARVAWIGAAAVPAPVIALQRRLERSLRDAGWTLDARPFHLHVTLARHCRAALETASVPVLRWAVDRFALFESVGSADGPRYAALAEWPMRAVPANDVTSRR